MQTRIYDIFRVQMLLSKDANKYWGMLIYMAVLTMIMIASSHSIESKIHDIAKRSNEVKELRAQFVDRRSYLMKLKMESEIIDVLGTGGIGASVDAPYKIIVRQ